MKTISTLLACGIISVACLPSSRAQILINETFDSYADTAAMNANWTRVQGAGNVATLDTLLGNPGQSGRHDGTAAATGWTGSSISVTPTDSAPLRLTADLWYSGASNQRNTVGLRNGASPLFEVGFYNDGALSATGLAVRVLNFAGNNNWVELKSYGDLGTGGGTEQWIRVEATFTGTALALTYDLGANGSVDGSFNSSGAGYANPFNSLRFGGPSALTSATGGFNVDNIKLEVIPEPSTLALTAFGALSLGMLARCRRRE